MKVDLLDWKLGETAEFVLDAEIKRFGQIFGCLHVLETHKYPKNHKMTWGQYFQIGYGSFSFWLRCAIWESARNAQKPAAAWRRGDSLGRVQRNHRSGCWHHRQHRHQGRGELNSGIQLTQLTQLPLLSLPKSNGI